MDRFELANFNLNLLVALDALLGERSVSAAAKLARVTPSAMSHSLAELRALHQMLSSLDRAGQSAARDEVGRALREFERPGGNFVGPCELVLAVGTK